MLPERTLPVILASLLPFPVCATQLDRDAAPKDAVDRTLLIELEQSSAVEGFLFSTVEIPARIRNRGSKAIRILDIAPRSGAGGGSAEPEILPPGAEGRLVLRRQLTELGAKPVTFRVRTDDREDPDYSVKARIFALSAYTPDLPGINFDVVRAGHGATQRLTVTSYETPRLDMKAVIESPPWIELKEVPRANGDSSQDLVLEVRIRQGAPRGMLNGRIHLLTSVAAQPDLVIPVQAKVFDSVAVSPMPATMKPAHPGENRQVMLEYRALDGKALSLAKVVDSTGALTLEQRACGRGCVKVLAGFQTDKVGEFGGTIHAVFDQRETPVDVGWNILVVPDSTKLIDLGVIGQEEVGTKGDARPGEQP